MSINISSAGKHNNSELNAPREVLSIQDVARLLNRSENTVYAWAVDGKLKGCGRKRGGCWYFSRKRVLEHFTNQSE